MLVSGDLTAVSVVSACVDAASDTAHLNALVVDTLAAESAAAIKAASDADVRRLRGQSLGPLDGIPISVKANYAVQGLGRNTTAASKALEGFVSPYDATPVARLKAAGAVVFGTANMDEFAMGSASHTGHHGPVVSPWSPSDAMRALEGVVGNYDPQSQGTHAVGDRGSSDSDAATRRRSWVGEHPDLARRLLVPGGSSGGGAVSVAVGSSLASLGSDTGGSVRQPASFSGVVGLKPTYGRVSRWGLVAYASSLDTPGVLARSVADAALVLDCIAGPDDHDSTSLPAPPAGTPTFSAALPAQGEAPDLRGVTVGVPVQYHVDGLDAGVVQWWSRGVEWLRDAGARVVEVSLPSTEAALPAYYVLAPAEAASNLARYDGVRYGHRTAADAAGAGAPDWGSARVGRSGDDSGGGGDDIGGDASALHDEYTRTRTEALGAEVKRRIMVGNFVLSQSARSDFYDCALAVRRQVADDFAAVFAAGVDALLTPTAPSGPWALGDMARMPPVDVYVQDVMTVPANLAGLPCVSVPVGMAPAWSAPSGGGDGGRVVTLAPTGLQVIGAARGEATMLRVAHALEHAAAFKPLDLRA